jgi:hypothetical protein
MIISCVHHFCFPFTLHLTPLMKELIVAAAVEGGNYVEIMWKLQKFAVKLIRSICVCLKSQHEVVNVDIRAL